MEGLKRKIMFKIKKNQNDFETTVMTPEFECERRNFVDYNGALTTLTSALEAIIQPDRNIVSAAKGGENIAYPKAGGSPLEDVHARLQGYKDHVKTVNLALVEKAVARASRIVRDQQKKVSAALNPMRIFHSTDYKRFEQGMKQFDEAKDKMDMAKHEVKSSKTTTEIEKKAVQYQEAVESFDNLCTKAIKLLEELPQIQKSHAMVLTSALSAHREYHRLMADAWK